LRQVSGRPLASPSAAPSAERPAAALRERLLALASLLALVLLAWLYLWHDARGMAAGAQGSLSGRLMVLSMTDPWSLAALGLAFLMWTVMMAGMMLPSAIPAVLFYTGLRRRSLDQGRALPAAWIFVAGYLAVWTGFSLAAVTLQALLQDQGLLTPMLDSTSAWLTGGLLLGAGLYQWLPLKRACLSKCRAPMQFFLMRWKPGRAGALAMGAEHGAYCLGCCWALMLLLFAAGVMHLAWVAVIALFVLAEKLLPAAWRLDWISGAGLVLAGAALLFAG
jgi:predicted metal-binding membrane protein